MTLWKLFFILQFVQKTHQSLGHSCDLDAIRTGKSQIFTDRYLYYG